MWVQRQIQVSSSGRGTYEITSSIDQEVAGSGIHCGLAHIFIHHTSASLVICENADPSVQTDLEAFMARTVPDGDPLFRHTAEGPDDMPAHVRSVLTQTGITVPVAGAQLALGTWQGIYLWEHRYGAHRRTLTITLQGDPEQA